MNRNDNNEQNRDDKKKTENKTDGEQEVLKIKQRPEKIAHIFSFERNRNVLSLAVLHILII